MRKTKQVTTQEMTNIVPSESGADDELSDSKSVDSEFVLSEDDVNLDGESECYT